jgi:hypothetical protein
MRAAPTVLFRYGGPMIVVHAGNRIDSPTRPTPRFPADCVDHVTETTVRLLSSLRPRFVVSAPAAGADLIVLAAAQGLGIPVEVVLPIARNGFIEASVADNGDEWVSRFHTVMGSPETRIRELHLDPKTPWWFEANAALLDVARERSAAHEPVVALTVRPTGGEFPPSVTDDFAERAGTLGLLILTIDPLSTADGSEVTASP